MKRFSRGLTALLIVALVCSMSSILLMEASCADPIAPTSKPDIPTPSVPQFTLAYVDHSYDVPPQTTSSTDPYTGKVSTTTIPGYHVTSFAIDVTIKNQPYPPTINNGNTSTLKYFIQVKGHYQTDDYYWIESENGIKGATVATSNSDYTVVSLPTGNVQAGAVDFRVAASLGYDYTYFYGLVPFKGWASADSDWSSVQTFTIPGTPASPTINPTQTTIQPTTPPSPTIPEFNPLTILILLTIIPLIIALFLRKNMHQKTSN
jgi:hypothetical protein